MGVNQDFVLETTTEGAVTETIAIQTVFAVNQFIITSASGTINSLINAPTNPVGGEVIINSNNIPNLNEGTYKFELIITVNGSEETIEGQFIVKHI